MAKVLHVLHWLAMVWKSWGATALIAGTASSVTWALSMRKQLNDSKRAKHEKSVDSRVMNALETPELWKGPRPMTGAGDRAVRRDELADELSLDEETITESLERLEARRRIVNVGGHLADPTPRWHTSRRF
jgi:hypothetical protein